MSQLVSSTHPAVVLRSRYQLMRSMLAVAMIAVVCLAGSVVFLAIDDDGAGSSGATPAAAQQPLPSGPNGTTRFDGGPEEGTRGALVAPPLTRFDGGPEEGTAGH